MQQNQEQNEFASSIESMTGKREKETKGHRKIPENNVADIKKKEKRLGSVNGNDMHTMHYPYIPHTLK